MPVPARLSAPDVQTPVFMTQTHATTVLALRHQGKVVLASDGQEAVEASKGRTDLSLAILDVVMPRLGGKEAFEAIRRNCPGLKAIFMSGYSANAIHESFVLKPGTPFLQKPFGPTVLVRKVREVLDAP